jgi:hypothetical protein
MGLDGGRGGPRHRRRRSGADQHSATSTVTEVVVTGSRIPRSDTKTVSPVTVLTQENLDERGIVNLGELLNQVTSNVPVLPISTSQGFPAVTPSSRRTSSTSARGAP